MIDHAHEVRRGKRFLTCAGILLVATYMVWGEVAYLLWGAKATATVTKAFDGTGRRGRRQHNVEFTFTEADGRARKDLVTTRANSGSLPAVGEQIEIQYTPGELGRSRRAGQVEWVWIAVFGVAVAATVVFAIL